MNKTSVVAALNLTYEEAMATEQSRHQFYALAQEAFSQVAQLEDVLKSELASSTTRVGFAPVGRVSNTFDGVPFTHGLLTQKLDEGTQLYARSSDIAH